MSNNNSTNTELLDSILGIEARAWGNASKLPAAIRITQALEPAGGSHMPVYPASYAGARDSDPPVYDLNGKQILPSGEVSHYLHCVIDSYQSQANRMEPAFANPPLSKLVPQITITVPRKIDADPEKTEQSLSVLGIAHRVADFRIKLSDQQSEVKSWIKAFDTNDALPLVQNLPTSVLFGFWDSRGLGTKHARILMSRIDAFDVVPCTKRSIYSGMYSKEEFLAVAGVEAAGADDKTLSERGFTNAPGNGLGGVLVRGGITRTSVLSLTDIARIRCSNGNVTLTNAARRYLFCLGMLAEAYQREMGAFNLRSGCELIALEKPNYELRGGEANQALLDLCQDQKALVAEALEAAASLGVSTQAASWSVTRDSLAAEFNAAVGKKADKRTAANAKKAAKQSKDTDSSPN